MLASLTFDSDIDNSMPEAATFPVAWGREVLEFVNNQLTRKPV